MQGIRVKLVSSFRGTEAQRELDAELKEIEEAQARSLVKQRHEREQIHAALRSVPDRPPSANPHSLKTMQSFDFLHSRASVPRLQSAASAKTAFYPASARGLTRNPSATSHARSSIRPRSALPDQPKDVILECVTNAAGVATFPLVALSSY